MLEEILSEHWNVKKLNCYVKPEFQKADCPIILFVRCTILQFNCQPSPFNLSRNVFRSTKKEFLQKCFCTLHLYQKYDSRTQNPALSDLTFAKANPTLFLLFFRTNQFRKTFQTIGKKSSENSESTPKVTGPLYHCGLS